MSFIYVLNSDFISDCNLHTKILHKYNARINIGCGVNVVLNPLKMVLHKTETYVGVD
jgi:hypothetical protein